MWVNRSKFMKALLSVKPALGKDENQKMFYFSDRHVRTYNGELLITSPLPDGLDIKGAVPAKKLIDLMKKTKTDPIEVELPPTRLSIGAEEMQARILRKEDLELRIWDLVEPTDTSWLNLPSDFQEKLRLCLFSASKSKNEPVLSCVRWRDKFLETCDNVRISRCVLDTAFQDMDVQVPAETAAILGNKNYDLRTFTKKDDWLHFRCQNDVVLSCRMYHDAYLPIDNIFALPFGKSFKLPTKLYQMLDSSQSSAEKDIFSHKVVLITIDDGRIIVEAHNNDDEFKEYNLINSKDNLQFYANPLYLMEILRRKCDRVAISDKREGFLDRFLKFEAHDFTHLIGVATVGSLTEPDSDGKEDHINPIHPSEPLDMYYSGIPGSEFKHDKLTVEMKNRLISFIHPQAELDTYAHIVEIRQHFRNIMIDSGAFSIWNRGGKIELDEYTEYCNTHINNFEYFVSLDVIPGSPGQKNLRLMPHEIENSAANGYANYRFMVQKGVLKEKIIHVFHQGENFKWLRKMVGEMEYIGLSPGNDRSTGEKIEWLTECMRYVTDENGRPIVKLHGFAVTSLKLMRLFPWASIDSATWGIIAGMGLVMMPRKIDGKWDFSSDVPLRFACSQLEGHPAHVHNQPGLVRMTVVDEYLKELELPKGKSSFAVMEKSYKLNKEIERRVTTKLGKRIRQEISPTAIEEIIGVAPALRDPGPDKKWVETIEEPGVINSPTLRQYLNVHYFNEFLKTLPKDRRFIRPENRANVRWFLRRNDRTEDHSAEIENLVQERLGRILGTAPGNLPSPTSSTANEDAEVAPGYLPTPASSLASGNEGMPQAIMVPKTAKPRGKVGVTKSVSQITITYKDETVTYPVKSTHGNFATIKSDKENEPGWWVVHIPSRKQIRAAYPTLRRAKQVAEILAAFPDQENMEALREYFREQKLFEND